ncbi:MAG TPA: hypothetical protein VMW72_21530 [Sedimentisphaerales bacterium]|nr:hypothetical protein [Sedimentisphaerales bacterium]
MYFGQCYAKKLCIDWRQKYGQNLFPICPVLSHIINKQDLPNIANIEKSSSSMIDSIKRILSVFDALIKLQPTDGIITWCAHRKNILQDCINLIDKDLILLPKRLENAYPETYKKCIELLVELKSVKFYYEFNRPDYLYLMPPTFARKNYLLFLNWQERQIKNAGLFEGNFSDKIEMRRLTCHYPAVAVKTMFKIYQELEPVVQILAEEPKSKKAPEQEKPTTEPASTYNGGENIGADKLKNVVWSGEVTKSKMMAKLKMDSYWTFNQFAKRHGIRQVGSNRQLFQIRLDKMNSKDREKLEKI